MANKRVLYYLTKVLIDFMFYSGILVCALVPTFVYKLAPDYVYNFATYNEMIEESPLRIILVLLVSGIASVYVLWEIRKIFNTLLNTNPFTLDNVNTLRKIAVASFIISITYVAKCLFWFTLGTAVIIIIFAIAGLFCLVLADVFKQAVIYKEENDLTV